MEGETPKRSSTRFTGRRHSTNPVSQRAPHVKRPKNAFFIYVQDQRENMRRENPNFSARELSQSLGAKWQALHADEKRKYYEAARKEEELHKEKFPNYMYKPVKRTAKQASKVSSKDTELSPPLPSTPVITNETSDLPKTEPLPQSNAIASSRLSPKCGQRKTVASLLAMQRNMPSSGQKTFVSTSVFKTISKSGDPVFYVPIFSEMGEKVRTLPVSQGVKEKDTVTPCKMAPALQSAIVVSDPMVDVNKGRQKGLCRILPKTSVEPPGTLLQVIPLGPDGKLAGGDDLKMVMMNPAENAACSPMGRTDQVIVSNDSSAEYVASKKDVDEKSHQLPEISHHSKGSSLSENVNLPTAVSSNVETTETSKPSGKEKLHSVSPDAPQRRIIQQCGVIPAKENAEVELEPKRSSVNAENENVLHVNIIIQGSGTVPGVSEANPSNAGCKGMKRDIQMSLGESCIEIEEEQESDKTCLNESVDSEKPKRQCVTADAETFGKCDLPHGKSPLSSCANTANKSSGNFCLEDVSSPAGEIPVALSEKKDRLSKQAAKGRIKTIVKPVSENEEGDRSSGIITIEVTTADDYRGDEESQFRCGNNERQVGEILRQLPARESEMALRFKEGRTLVEVTRSSSVPQPRNPVLQMRSSVDSPASNNESERACAMAKEHVNSVAAGSGVSAERRPEVVSHVGTSNDKPNVGDKHAGLIKQNGTARLAGLSRDRQQKKVSLSVRKLPQDLRERVLNGLRHNGNIDLQSLSNSEILVEEAVLTDLTNAQPCKLAPGAVRRPRSVLFGLQIMCLQSKDCNEPSDSLGSSVFLLMKCGRPNSVQANVDLTPTTTT